jgi:tripartite-type tricarboxylate transporter receptor subunit TctC
VHIAYKGVAPAIVDLMAGRVQAMISAPSAPMAYVRDGRLRALAYSGPKRLAELPSVPTFAEGGLPGFDARGWFGVAMHSATPAPIRAWLSEQVWSVVQSAEYQKNAILKNGYEVPAVDPAAMPAFLAEDRAKWKRTVGEIRDRLV